MKKHFTFFLALCAVSALVFAADVPSRKAFDGCKWEKLSDPNAGLAAWVMRCDDRGVKTDFAMNGQTLEMRVSGEKPMPVVRVIDLQPGETAKQAMRRFFDTHTEKSVAKRCVLAKFDNGFHKPPAGVVRYTFIPDAAYKKELDAKNNPDEIPDPPCGDWGDQPDFVAYFEVHDGARRVLFVDAGQDDPLYDEQTLQLLPTKGKK